jgi:MerR family transcriptional regulator, light-induced transcriptional regulator
MRQEEGPGALFPIGAVARKTGLSTHVLRAWERRYGVVEPKRNDAGTRVYDEADVVRLRLLKRVTQQGHAISQVAELATPDLLALLRDEPVSQPASAARGAQRLVGECLEAIEAMDSGRVHAQLMRSLLLLGAERFLDEVAIPLLYRVGDLWESGTLCPAHEHLLSTNLQRVLAWMMERVGPDRDGPAIVVTTPAGQRHEMGALISSVVAAEEGWRVEYLGPDLPAEDIARAAAAAEAAAVALSVVHETPARVLLAEVRQLRDLVPGDVAIFVGGRAATEHRDGLARAGVQWVRELGTLRAELRSRVEALAVGSA